MPETTPEGLTAATDGLELSHVPPPASLKVVVLPTQALVVPVIGPGNGSTVTDVVADTPPQGLAS